MLPPGGASCQEGRQLQLQHQGHPCELWRCSRGPPYWARQGKQPAQSREGQSTGLSMPQNYETILYIFLYSVCLADTLPGVVYF